MMTYTIATSLGCVGLGLPRSPLSRLALLRSAGLLFGCLLKHQQVLRARVVLGGPRVFHPLRSLLIWVRRRTC